MSLVDRSQLDVKLGDYAAGAHTALADATILPRVQAWRRGVAGRMVPIDKRHIHTVPTGRWQVSRKIDGEFNALVATQTEAALVNPGGTVRVGLPFLADLPAMLKKAGVTRLIAAGELHAERPEGARERVHDVSRIARRPESAAELAQLRFTAFDIIEVDGADAPAPHSAAMRRLAEILPASGPLSVIASDVLEDAAAIAARFEAVAEKGGAEGLVAWSDTGGIFKIKPRHTLDVVVVGFAEGTADRAGLLHDLLIAVARADGALHLLGRVGGGFTEELRRTMLADLKDMAVPSDYSEINSDRVAYEMVRPEWVIEISCLDLVSHNSRGAAVEGMVLLWEGGRYRPVRRLPLASIISPQFVRRRDDKSPVAADAGIAQLSRIVEIDGTDRPLADLALPASTVLRRQAATKTLKGVQMVRKLVLWKTNKEQHSADYPAYVLHVTDFSPGRKTPLEREIRVTNSLAQAEALWESLAAEYFVKGWAVQG